MKIRKTIVFDRWFKKLKDRIAKNAINARLTRIQESGLFGDCKRFGRLSELRFDIGPGYRVYFTVRSSEIVVLLVGGSKTSQSEDIKKATQMIIDLFGDE